MIWLPFADFTESARCFDSRTLSIQRFEIWHTLVALEKGNPNNPNLTARQGKIMNMWRGHETWLVCYGMACSLEWERRMEQEAELTRIFRKYLDTADLSQPFPWWVGDATISLSHRSNMVALNPEYYLTIWPGMSEGLDLAFPNDGEE